MTFRPAPFPDGRRALLVAGFLALLEVGLVWLLLTRRPSGGSVILLLLALALLIPVALLLWRAWLCLSLAYWIDRNAVTIAWGPWRQVLPLGEIAQIRRGTPAAPLARWRERWPWADKALLYGPDLGKQLVVDGQEGLSVASRPPTEQLLLVTQEGVFGTSPADPDGFLASLARHHALGPTHLVRQARYSPPVLTAPLWRDRLGLGLLAAGLAGSVLLLSLLLARFPGLPPAIAGLDGAAPSALFAIPAFAFLAWLVNGAWGLLVYRQQRVAAWLLWAGVLAVQVLALLALLSLTR